MTVVGVSVVWVPEPPSVGVDSSFDGGEHRPAGCRSLQVWGWTVLIG